MKSNHKLAHPWTCIYYLQNQAATSQHRQKIHHNPHFTNLTIFREVNNHTIQRIQLNYSEKIVHTESNIYSHNQVKKLLRFFTKLHNRI